MHLTLIRHGHAASASGPERADSDRVLSLEGRTAIRRAGSELAKNAPVPTHLSCSPLVRAVQTAEIIAAGLGFEGLVEVRRCLLPEGSQSALLEWLAGLDPSADVLVAGHQPFMGVMATILLGEHVGSFPTASVMRIDLRAPEPDQGQLLWQWRPGG